MVKKILICLTIIFSMVLNNCTPSPRPIRFGDDQCVYCKMVIMDRHYGAEMVTKKGKTFTFDSIECMAAYHVTQISDSKNIHSLWVVAFENEGQLVKTDDAVILHSENLRSPMGLNLAAFADQKQATARQLEFKAEVFPWSKILLFVKEQWSLN